MPVKINYLYYPFLCTSRDYPRLFMQRPILFVAGSPDLRSKLMVALEEIIERGEISLDSLNDQDESILIYNVLVDIAKLIGDKRLANKIALAYSKLASSRLESESDENLVAIANKLGLSAALETMDFPKIPVVRERKTRGGKALEFIEVNEYKYAIPVRKYLEVVSTRLIHDPMYNLANLFVSDSRVFLDKHLFSRIIEERIYHVILEKIENSDIEEVSEIESLILEVKDILNKYQEKIIHERTISVDKQQGPRSVEQYTGILVEELFPPCIRKILDVINAGGNPSHHERFNLAAFLGYIGLGVDEILEYFKKTADYKDRIARYQVEHILGLRGSRVKYKPYNCEKMKSMNICPITEQCAGGKNPLSVYKYNLRRHIARTRVGDESESIETNSKGAAGGI